MWLAPKARMMNVCCLYGFQVTSCWWKETLCQLMLRHLDLLDAGCLDARTYVHTHRHTHDWALGSRSIWFFEIVETDWAILLDSTEGLNIVRSAAKQTSPHTHTHTRTHSRLTSSFFCWFQCDTNGATDDLNSCFWSRGERRPHRSVKWKWRYLWTVILQAYSATFRPRLGFVH